MQVNNFERQNWFRCVIYCCKNTHTRQIYPTWMEYEQVQRYGGFVIRFTAHWTKFFPVNMLNISPFSIQHVPKHKWIKTHIHFNNNNNINNNISKYINIYIYIWHVNLQFKTIFEEKRHGTNSRLSRSGVAAKRRPNSTREIWRRLRWSSHGGTYLGKL